MSKDVLFICYWGLDDALTTATALPMLAELQNRQDVKRILFVTIERDGVPKSFLQQSKVEHHPIYSRCFSLNLLTKIYDFVSIPAILRQLAQKHKLNLIIAHGAPSGALAYKVWEKLKIPFYVSLFEPHADYMLHSDVWSSFSLKYKFQKHWERLQIKHAAGLMPVSKNYGDKIRKYGVVNEKVCVVPCPVEQEVFGFNKQERHRLRQSFRWEEEAIVGIYAGKYGDLYYKEEAAGIYKKCFELVPDFRLIILSPQPKQEIEWLLNQHDIDPAKVHIASVSHSGVPQYLSAADFAFATYKPGPSKKYLSPVKIGEYWANGLPVLLTEGIGDESEIIKKEGGGALFNLRQKRSVEKAISDILQIVKSPGHRKRIPQLAQNYRSPERIKEAFEFFFGKGQEVEE